MKLLALFLGLFVVLPGASAQTYTSNSTRLGAYTFSTTYGSDGTRYNTTARTSGDYTFYNTYGSDGTSYTTTARRKV